MSRAARRRRSFRTLRPRYYAKGDDWQDKLPDEEIRACEELGIDIVFLDTVTHSSSDLIRSLGARV